MTICKKLIHQILPCLNLTIRLFDCIDCIFIVYEILKSAIRNNEIDTDYVLI